MTETGRWIATVDKDGKLLEVSRYHGHDDDGCVAKLTTYDESIQAIAGSAKEALERVRQCWKAKLREAAAE